MCGKGGTPTLNCFKSEFVYVYLWYMCEYKNGSIYYDWQIEDKKMQPQESKKKKIEN